MRKQRRKEQRGRMKYFNYEKLSGKITKIVNFDNFYLKNKKMQIIILNDNE